MKRSLLTVFLVFGLLQANAKLISRQFNNPGANVSFNVGTYNIRHQKAMDIPNDTWTARYPNIAGLVKKYAIDIFGVQEPSLADMNNLMPLLPHYTFTGQTNEGGTAGYYSAIIYNTDRFTLNQTGTFWLSATPDVISYGWDAAARRICTWGKFTDKMSGLVFYHFNTHLDHIGKVARKEGAALILRNIDAIAGAQPVVFTGDFNVDQFDSTYIFINNSPKFKNAYDLTNGCQDVYTGTFNSFDTSRHDINRIDHIFLTAHFKANTYNVITDKYNTSHYPSDHFPVVVHVEPRQTENGALYRAFPEDFENGTAKTAYPAGNSTLSTGSWLFDNAVLRNTANDASSSGIFAARMAGGLSVSAYLQMNFDVTSGASRVVIWYSSYKAADDAPCQWTLEYSTNGGTSWVQTGSAITATSKKKQQVLFPMNIQGNVRFRINKLGLGATNNGRLSIDDIAVFRSDSSQVLPEPFINFNAVPVSNDAGISWNVQCDSSISHFDLWRSRNGVDFEPVAQIQARPQVCSYNYVDQVNGANNFYRLHQVTKDGNIFFSPVVFVNFGHQQITFKIQSANRNSVAAYIQANTADKGSLSIFSIEGKMVETQQVAVLAGSHLYTIDSRLSTGVYVATLVTESKRNISVKFMIQ